MVVKVVLFQFVSFLKLQVVADRNYSPGEQVRCYFNEIISCPSSSGYTLLLMCVINIYLKKAKIFVLVKVMYRFLFRIYAQVKFFIWISIHEYNMHRTTERLCAPRKFGSLFFSSIMYLFSSLNLYGFHSFDDQMWVLRERKR